MIKRKIFLLVVIMTLVVSSCSQGVSSEFEAGAPAKLEIQLGIAATKASGKVILEAADAGITNVTVGVFDGDRVDVIATSDYTAGSIVTVTATAGNRTFVVVANAPKGSFAGIQTKQDFLAKKIALTQEKSLMLMSSALISTTLTVEDKVTVPTQVVRLAARIQLENVKTAFDENGAYSDATFEMDKVFMYNVRGTSTVGDIPTTITTELEPSNLIHGILADKTSVSTLVDMLSSKVLFPTALSYAVGNHFYVFENSVASNGNDAKATKIVIGGTFKKNKLDLVGTYVYYPIVVNKKQSGTQINDVNGVPSKVVGIKRNCRYAINATIKSIGVDSPDKFMNPSDLELGITVTPWGAEIVQNTEL